MSEPRISQRSYGRMPDGRPVIEYTLDNGLGLRLQAINLGGIVTALLVPDRQGRAANVVLGLPDLAAYLGPHPHFGTIVGRFANRIAAGRFELDGQAHQLALNDGPNSLHGGPQGFGKRFWSIYALPGEPGRIGIELRHVSAHGDEGYPGELRLAVRYELSTTANTWRIGYRAETDRPTVLNLSHHDYFNLAGQGSVMAHRLTLPASRYCPVDATLIPTGLAEVEGTPFDFRQPMPIGERIRDGHAQMLIARGYDHNWVLDRAQERDGLALAARLAHEPSGRTMEVHTTEPGVQFYSGNFLDGSLLGSGGAAIRQGDGLCLETQHFPDSPNRPEFPSTVLRPGEVFRSVTEHRFGIA